jgi:hypothetical protein
MVKRVFGIMVAALLGLSLVAGQAARAAEEQVENPAYKSWKAQKPGTTVTMESSSAVAGQTFKTEITQKLIAVTPEAATVERTTKINVPGVPPQPAQKMQIPAKVDKSRATPGQLPTGVKGEMKDKGTEKVTVAGKEYSCKVYEFTGESNGVKTTGKSWTSEEIPGGMVKLESSSNVGGNDAKTTIEVTKIETK